MGKDRIKEELDALTRQVVHLPPEDRLEAVIELIGQDGQQPTPAAANTEQPDPPPANIPTSPASDIIRAVVREHPSLVFVREVSNTSSLLDRNTSYGSPYLHDVNLHFGFREAEYDLTRMNKVIDQVIEGLKPHSLLKLEELSRQAYMTGVFYWRSRDLILPRLLIYESLGVIVETTTWTFKTNGSWAKSVIASQGMEEGREYTKTHEKPMFRTVSATFHPSVSLAHLAATTQEMKNIPRQEDRSYPFKNSLYAYYDRLSLEDIERLKKNPAYVQEIADESLIGYTVPGIEHPNMVARLVFELGRHIPTFRFS